MRRALLAATATMALALGVPTAAHAGNPDNQQSRFPWTDDYPTCTGETVHLTGFIEEVYTYQSPQHLSARYNIHATGTTASGVKYVGSEVMHQTESANGFHRVLSFHLNRPGNSIPGDDEVGRTNVQVRYVNGTLVVDRTTDFDRCQ